MKYTITEFASQIRNLYPGDYNDLTDSELVKLWVKKYPNDIDKIEINKTTIIREKESSSESFSFGWIFILIFLVIAFFTNPGPVAHKEEIKSKLNVYLQREINNTVGDSGDIWSKLGGAVGSYIGKAALDELVDQSVSSDDYLVFSLTKFSFQGETNIIAIGLFGKIFTFPQFDKEVDKAFKKLSPH